MLEVVGNLLQIVGYYLIFEGCWRILKWWWLDRHDNGDGPGRFAD